MAYRRSTLLSDQGRRTQAPREGGCANGYRQPTRVGRDEQGAVLLSRGVAAAGCSRPTGCTRAFRDERSGEADGSPRLGGRCDTARRGGGKLRAVAQADVATGGAGPTTELPGESTLLVNDGARASGSLASRWGYIENM